MTGTWIEAVTKISSGSVEVQKQYCSPHKIIIQFDEQSITCSKLILDARLRS